MSDYAKIIEPMKARPRKSKSREWMLVPGTQIKNVLCFDEGYTFDALLGGEWLPTQTAEDLPAFTDKGSAARLTRGKPRRSGEASAKSIGCKVTPEELDRVKQLAAEAGQPNVSAFVRAKIFGGQDDE